MPKDRLSGTRLECKCCHELVGPEVKVAPFFVPDGDGGKDETFCPQCLVHVRAPLEPLRFFPGSLAAVKCAKCSWTSVAVGLVNCGQCRDSRVVLLPPKPSPLL